MFPPGGQLKAQNAFQREAWCWLTTTPTHEMLSELPSCTRMRLRGGHVADHEGSCASPWVGGMWTLQGRLVVRVNSMVEISMGHSPTGCYAARDLVGHDLRCGLMLLRPRESQPEWAKSSQLGDSIAN